MLCKHQLGTPTWTPLSLTICPFEQFQVQEGYSHLPLNATEIETKNKTQIIFYYFWHCHHVGIAYILIPMKTIFSIFFNNIAHKKEF